MKRFASFIALSALLAGGSARADVIPSWTYSWDPGGSSISADSPGTGGVSFTTELPKSANGNSDIVATNLRIFSSADATTPDSMVTGGQYALSLTIADDASGQTGSVTFNGKLTGTFSLFNSNLSNEFDNTAASPTTQTLALGDNLYTVNIVSYSPPGPPTASNAGSIGAHVDVETSTGGGGGGGGGGIAETPEPTSLMLSCFGLSALGAASWRKRRRASVA